MQGYYSENHGTLAALASFPAEWPRTCPARPSSAEVTWLHHGIPAILVASAEPCASTDPCGIVQSGQFFPQDGISGDQDGLDLVDRLVRALSRGNLTS
ncbi:hypothetical protein ACQEVX_28970 [Streptomyces syringium]|uniref:hypothetical protein n=1 Tax=Streptomyces syringium TaxID=76729 RepID=UPI003D8B2FEE